MAIKEFSGEYRFLSNFYFSKLLINNYHFNSVEAAFQACKSEDPAEWRRFETMSAGEAKRAGRKLNLRSNWNNIRIEVMKELLEIKFTIPDLRTKLINTGDQELIEGNYWGDTFWGVCKGRGENNLGKLLMAIREQIQ